LKRVAVLVNRLNSTCDELKSHILAAKQDSAPVLDEASTLLSRKQDNEQKQQLLEAFRKHFTLPDEDLTTLTSSAEPVNERFYAVLQKVQQTHHDCELLLGSENQRLGLEVMEQTSRNLDAGFKKLYTWIQREFKGIDLEDPHISSSIRRALRALSERPSLFQNCLDYFAQARDVTLAEAFQSALTGSGSGQAIEFSTHDPLRYIGDMLAWVHSAAVSEKEALEGLFISDADEISRHFASGRTSEPWNRIKTSTEAEQDDAEDDDEKTFDGRKALNDLISRNTVSVCEGLHQRIALAARNNDDPVLLYKIFNLLTFYKDIFAKLIGSETSIIKTIESLDSLIMARFEELVEEDVVSATVDTTPPTNLSPPAFLSTLLKQFSDIARSRGPQMGTQELEQLFKIMLSGVLDACAEGATQLPDSLSSSAYKANYLMALRNALRSIASQSPAVSLPLDKVENELRVLQNTLVEIVTTSFLDASAVTELLQGADSRQDRMSRAVWFQESLPDAALKLDEFLSVGLMDAQDAIAKVNDKNAAKQILEDAVDRFCAEFDELEMMITSLDNESVNGASEDDAENVRLRDLYPRTSSEVRALLS
jgi:conserved oligomeric Golgi complex subunit 6